VKEARGLTPEEYFLYANVDAAQHGFRPEINLPWLAEVFFGKADFSPQFRKQIEDSAAAPPAW
jgi:hypothetical protein